MVAFNSNYDRISVRNCDQGGNQKRLEENHWKQPFRTFVIMANHAVYINTITVSRLTFRAQHVRWCRSHAHQRLCRLNAIPHNIMPFIYRFVLLCVHTCHHSVCYAVCVVTGGDARHHGIQRVSPVKYTRS